MVSKIRKLRAWYNRPKSTLASWVESAIVILPIVFIVRTWFYGLYQVPTGSMEPTMLVGEGFFADKLSVWFKNPKHGDIITFNDPNYEYSKNKLMEYFQRYVWGPTNLTKRVIGVPGDTIKLTVEDGKPVVYRNGEKLNEKYLNPYPIILTYNPDSSRSISYKTYDPQYSYHDQPFYRLTPTEVKLGKILAERSGQESQRKPGTPLTEVVDQYGKEKVVDEQEIVLGPDEYWVMGDNRLGSADARSWGHPLKEKYIHGKIVFRLWSFDSGKSWLILDLLRHPIDFWTRVRWSRFLQPVR